MRSPRETEPGSPKLPEILLVEAVPSKLIADIAKHTAGHQDGKRIYYRGQHSGIIDFEGNPSAADEIEQSPYLQFGDIVTPLSSSALISRPTSVTFLWIVEGGSERSIRTLSVNNQGTLSKRITPVSDIIDPSQLKAVEMLDRRPPYPKH